MRELGSSAAVAAEADSSEGKKAEVTHSRKGDAATQQAASLTGVTDARADG